MEFWRRVAIRGWHRAVAMKDHIETAGWIFLFILMAALIAGGIFWAPDFSQQVQDWATRVGWLVGTLVLIALAWFLVDSTFLEATALEDQNTELHDKLALLETQSTKPLIPHNRDQLVEAVTEFEKAIMGCWFSSNTPRGGMSEGSREFRSADRFDAARDALDIQVRVAGDPFRRGLELYRKRWQMAVLNDFHEEIDTSALRSETRELLRQMDTGGLAW
jgi:hypothetical protein